MPIHPVIVGEHLADPKDHRGEEMQPRTAAELRQLCRELGEPFDANLDEAQARERIEALHARKESED